MKEGRLDEYISGQGKLVGSCEHSNELNILHSPLHAVRFNGHIVTTELNIINIPCIQNVILTLPTQCTYR